MGYIHILRLPAANQNDFFYPHRPLFSVIPAKRFSFWFSA